MSAIVLWLFTVSIAVSLILTLILCICRNKSKSNSGPNNVNHLLPLNSIRSSDLQTNPLELIRYNVNGINGSAIDETDHHLKPHTQRALPDIPSAVNSSHLISNEFDKNRDSVQPNEIKHSIEIKCRPTKARAPQPPTHHVMTCPTIPTTDDIHHSYARIKDNAVIDSSENETDDYYDPHFCTPSARTVSNDSEDLSPPVPTKRFVNETNIDIPFRALNPSTSRAVEDIGFISGPVLLRNHSNRDSYSHSSIEENRIHSNGTEISYNTISVREPLAKVLAERAHTEHHYNEVEEERVSSFYEEIAGSTVSSVTYSKIGDVLSNNLPQTSTHKTETVVPNETPIVHSFALDSTDSSLTQPKASTATITPNCDSFLLNNPKDLYSSVDKKMKSKSYNRQTIHSVPDSDNEFDNLYAKVQKVSNKPKDNTIYANPRPSSVSEGESMTLTEMNMPPPLPPPLKLHQSTQSRNSRTISMYDSYNSVPNTSSHQRRYSSGNQSINTNDWQNRDINEEVFNYESVGRIDMDLENDPGYEVIHKKSKKNQNNSDLSANPVVNGFGSGSGGDPGYEAIRYDESDFDPNYEVITKKVKPKPLITEIVDPGYEVIKRVPQIQNKPQNRFEINRNISDVSSEPGYERIRFTQKTVSEESESEPNYASISRNEQFYDREEEHTISERL